MKKGKKIQQKETPEADIDKIRRNSPVFLLAYDLSIFVVYIGAMIFAWYFVNLAYSVNITSYDITCSECEYPYYLLRLSLLTIWVFCFYFYILNEIRFRIWDCKKRLLNKNIIKKGNYYISAITVVATVLTFLKVLL